MVKSIVSAYRTVPPFGVFRFVVIFCSLAASLAVARCASAQQSVPQPAAKQPPIAAWAEPRERLDLADALAFALARNPELAASLSRLHASEGRVLNAGLRPNPQAAVAVEDVAGSGAFRGAGEAQTTLRLSQLMELGGKRSARIREAELTRELSGWDTEAKRLDVAVQTTRAFVDVLGLQQQLSLAADAVRLAGRVVETAATRVRAGSASPAEEIKAKMALAGAEIEQSQLRRTLDIARGRLAAQWGSSTPLFSEVRGDLDAVEPVPDIAVLREHLARNPDLARWASEIGQRRAALERERTLAVPDLTAGVGYRRLSGPEENALVFELSIPLPVTNRNQGAILEAERLLTAAAEERRAEENNAAIALAETHQTLAGAYEQLAAVRSRVLPGAEKAFGIVNEGYREGRFGYLDVLDAQRTLIAARGLQVRTLMDYHKAVAMLERLVGATVQGSVGSDGNGRD